MVATNLAVFSSLVLAQLATSVYASCSTFDPVPGLDNSTSLTYTTIGATLRVSAVVDCSNPTGSTSQDPYLDCDRDQCSLSSVTNFLFNLDSTLNISVPFEQERDILALVKSNLSELAGSDRYNFNTTQTYTITGVSFCIVSNQTEYIGFTPTLICSTGYLSGCSGDGAPADGTAVTACGVRTLSFRNIAGFPIADGELGGVFTNAGALPAPANETNIVTNNGTSNDNGTDTGDAANSEASSYSVTNGVWVWTLMATAIICSVW